MDSIIVFATSAGSTAEDGTGRNGLFTGHLLTHLKTPGLEVTEVFRRTMSDVSRSSNNQQRPALYIQFSGLAYLGSQPATITQPVPATQTVPQPAPVTQPVPTPQPAPAPETESAQKPVPPASLLSLPVPVFAQSRVVDNAGLLSSGEIEELKRLISGIAYAYDFDLVIVTEKDIGEARPMDYADDFFDYSGYGLGEDRDGCLFLQVTGSRDYWFSTSGRGIEILNSAAYGKLKGEVVKFLKADEPMEAYRVYISCWEKFLALDAKGKRFNYIQAYAPAFCLVALVASLFFHRLFFVWKRKKNTV